MPLYQVWDRARTNDSKMKYKVLCGNNEQGIYSYEWVYIVLIFFMFTIF